MFTARIIPERRLDEIDLAAEREGRALSRHRTMSGPAGPVDDRERQQRVRRERASELGGARLVGRVFRVPLVLLER